MLGAVVEWSSKWGDLASVAGVGLTILGFAATLIGVFKSKSAAEKAAAAAREMRASLLYVDTVAELASALTTMEEIKRLHRAAAWPVLPDRYATLRRQLVGIVSAGSPVSDGHRGALQIAIDQLVAIERKVETAIARSDAPPNPAKLNQVVSEQIDRLEAVLRTLQRQIP